MPDEGARRTGGWSAVQIATLALTAFAIVLDGFDNQLIGFAMPALLADWQVSRVAMAPVLAASLIGMTVGSIVAGLIGDRIGRKRALVLSVVIFGVATAAVSIAQNVTQLTLLRFAAGLGLGGAMPNAASLIGESVPVRHRILAVSFTAVCVPLGGVLAGMVAAQVLPVVGWRVLFLIGGCMPTAFGLLLWLALPESASFLKARRDGKGKLIEPARRGESLIGPSYRRDTLALCIAFFSCLLSVYSAFNWLPTLMSQAAYDLKASSTALVWFNVGGVIAALAAGWASGRIGTRTPLLVLLGLGIAAAGGLSQLPLGPRISFVPLLCGLTLLGASSAGAQSVLTALATRIYPVSMRATGVGTAVGFGRLGGIASSIIGAMILSSTSVLGFFELQFLALLSAAAAVLLIQNHEAPAH